MSQPQPTGTPTAGIPMNTAGSKYHWWYDSKAAGVSNATPTGMTGRSPPGNYSMLSQSPPAAGDFNPAVPTKRRDSLKNMVHLCDFATP